MTSMKNEEQKYHYNAQEQEALDFHSNGKAGKLEIMPTKPMATQRDLSLAYSPGVAIPVKEIFKDPENVYKYTAKGNLVAVISNGSAILGLGNLGALASKPVMEGKSVLFKRFADVDSIDLEIDTLDIEEFIASVRYLGPSFGGINLEDIKAPDCFLIEKRLQELMSIPVFHDDQHGTAIIAAAGLLNALYLTQKKIEDIQLVCNGAGSAGIACIELMKKLGLPKENVILCDTKGVIYKGRLEGMNEWKEAHAIETKKRTLEEAMQDADVFIGVSAKGALSKEMVLSMKKSPIIFAMANPDPEITPEEVAQIRDDAIIATGRSDYPNQINNVLCFPYIFRGALDVQASMINDEMKIAAVHALAELARENVPEEVAAAYQGSRPRFGSNYIIPVPFDPRLIYSIPVAVAKAAMKSGVAQKSIENFETYIQDLKSRRDPIAATMRQIVESVQKEPKKIVFADGEEEEVIRAAISYVQQRLGVAILIGREEKVQEIATFAGLDLKNASIHIVDIENSQRLNDYIEYFYKKNQRRGWLKRDCQRAIKSDKDYFAALMVALGDADGLVTGVTKAYETNLSHILNVIDQSEKEQVSGISIAICRDRTVFISDTSVCERPDAMRLANNAEQAANFAKSMGYSPRVAFLSASSFGRQRNDSSICVQKAIEILKERKVDFEFDGEMTADAALNKERMALYPFMSLTDTANILMMPDYHSASITAKMLQELGGATLIGPILTGLEESVQILPLGAKNRMIVDLAILAAYRAQK